MEVKRGQIWWVCLDDTIGSEQQSGRPGVILTGNSSNETEETVVVAFLTSGGYSHPQTVSVIVGGERKRVLCRQLRTVDKRRLSRLIGTITAAELTRISGALAATLCLPNPTTTPVVRPTDDSEKTELSVQVDTYKRQYEELLNMYVSLRVEHDVLTREMDRLTNVPPTIEIPFEELDVPVEDIVVPEEQTETVGEPKKQIDINRCSEDELAELNLAPHVIAEIIANRPYLRKDSIKKLHSVTSIMYQLIEKDITVGDTVEYRKPKEKQETDIPDGKLNINTARGNEFMRFGINHTYATKIRKARAELGRFESIEDLVTVGIVGERWFNSHKDILTVGDAEVTEPTVVEQEEAMPSILNLNKASVRELMSIGFGKSEAARIYHHRKRNGDYRSVDDLSFVDGVTSKVLRKVRDKLEV